MIEILRQLARRGDLAWLSYHFAEFVAHHTPGEADPLAILSAALVCEASQQGSACIHLPAYTDTTVFDSTQAELAIPSLETWIECLRLSSLVGMPGEHCPLTLERERLYLNRYWWYEHRVAEQILARLAASLPGDNQQPFAFDSGLAGDNDLDADQRRSVELAANQRFSVVSGGPGSGKTSTVVRILSVLLALDPDIRIALAAPTGKAAARMFDSIRQQVGSDDPLRQQLPEEATTLHRLLGYNNGRFVFDAGQPLPFDCVVVDEASMIDLKLMHHLLDAVPPTARLVLLGDRDQLASVSAGNVLGDITGHGLGGTGAELPIAAALTLLRQNYRFGNDSAIAQLANEVNRGNVARSVELMQNGNGLVWHHQSAAAPGADVLGSWLADCEAVFDSPDPATALARFDRSQVLCAVNFGARGVFALNRSISASLLARNNLAPIEQFHGLPIMVQRNDYELGLFNGDTGILWNHGSGLRAWFRHASDGLRDIAINRLPAHLPAWAISVHKSQGSEFDRVLLLLPDEPGAEVLTRELLYTAITRARHEFGLLASPEVLRHTVERMTLRHSGLAVRLGWPETGSGTAPAA